MSWWVGAIPYSSIIGDRDLIVNKKLAHRLMCQFLYYFLRNNPAANSQWRTNASPIHRSVGGNVKVIAVAIALIIIIGRFLCGSYPIIFKSLEYWQGDSKEKCHSDRCDTNQQETKLLYLEVGYYLLTGISVTFTNLCEFFIRD